MGNSSSAQLPKDYDPKLHFTLKTPLRPPFPEDTEMITFGMGCFWCSENLFMSIPGVYTTHSGYAQGQVDNPTYSQVCGGRTGHAEVVRVVYKPTEVGLSRLLETFWEGHNPTTKNKQKNDSGTQYRSGIYYYTEAQKELSMKSKLAFQQVLDEKYGGKKIVTEVEKAQTFYYAEENHQQYDAKPGTREYNGMAPTGYSLPKNWNEEN